MNRKDIDVLKSKVVKEFERRKFEIDQEMKKQLEALDTVASLLDDGLTLDVDKAVAPLARTTKTDTDDAKNDLVVATAKDAIKIMDECEKVFSKRDAENICREKYPHLTISRNSWHNAIKKKKRAGEVIEVTKSSGRRPAEYEKTEKYKERRKGLLY